MRRSLPVLAALLSLVGSPDDLWAGQRDRVLPVAQRVSAAGSRIIGTVTDQAGTGIAGVTVLAMGTTLAMARSDVSGAFTLAVPAGEYILRVTRDGYVSTYREAVRVQSDLPLRRHITLLKPADADRIVLASLSGAAVEAQPALPPAELPEPPAQAPSETVWRLRHLPRTVLRDQASGWGSGSGEDGTRDPFRVPDWLAGGWGASRQVAADLNGHVDFLTTSSLAASGDLPSRDWPRGVAYVVLGAPVGTHGDWLVRAALAAGDASAWTFVGEYRARTDQRHAFKTGATYSAQTLVPASGVRLSMAQPFDVRRAAGVYGFDRWAVGRGLELEYGGHLDRVDYLVDPNLVGGTVGARQHLLPRTTLFVKASRQMVAPGADQFQPPSAAGAWLPPERTFSPLDTTQPLRPEQVDRREFGVDIRLRGGDVALDGHDEGLALRVRRISEDASNQIATLFGIDEASQVAHYYISSPGSVSVDGWAVGMTGRLAPHVVGVVDYTATDATWSHVGNRYWLRRVARSAARRERERAHDVTSSVQATLPATETRVVLAVRFNSAFSQAGADRPGFGGRFAVEVRQPLPFQPLDRSVLNLVVAARTLLSDVDDRGGFHDDLLTVAPPLRLTCGIQMRF